MFTPTSCISFEENCTEGFDYFDMTGSCYGVFLLYRELEVMNGKCSAMVDGATLASITSPSEQRFIHGMDSDHISPSI